MDLAVTAWPLKANNIYRGLPLVDFFRLGLSYYVSGLGDSF